MQDFCNQLNGSAAVGSKVWNENKGTRKDPDSSQFLQNQFSISEASTGAVSTPNSIPSSVIFSSNYCGVKGATDNFDNASSLIYNTAHLKDSLSSSSQASVPAEATSHGIGASIVCRSLNLDYDNSQHSNSHCAQFSPIAGQSHFTSSPTQRVDSPAMWNVANSCEGTQGSSVNKSLNQIPHQGAKSTHSDSRAGNSSLQQAPSESFNDCHSTSSDMQTNVQNMDSNPRYNNNDTTTSSHSTNSSTGFMSNNGNNVYRSSIGCGNGVHSSNLQLLNIGANNESNSQSSSFGAPYNNSVNSRAKIQPGNCESAFTGWQGLNTSTTSVPASNGWIIPNSLSSRNAHDSSCKEGIPKDGDENMVVDNEMSYSDLIGSNGGTENGEGKQQISNGGQGSMSWGMPSRLGLLGGGDGPVNPGSNVWNNNQGPVTSSGSNTWDNSRQNSGTASESQGESPDMMDSQSGFSRLIGAIGGSEYEGKQDGSSNNFKQNASRPLPPRLGLLGGGESSLNTASSGWGNSSSAGTSNPGWVGGGPRSNNGSSDMTGNNGSGMSPPKPHNSWAQAAGKGLPQSQPTPSGSGGQHISSNPDVRISASDNPSAPKAQSDAITEIKVKAAVSEGWGQTPVNQDAPWEVPPSPPLPVDPSTMKDAPPVWRAPVNNGTEIWENNLRLSKGTVAPVTSTAPPWGHTPATNIGGHWGDDDSSNNMWNGAPQPTSQGNSNWAEPNPNVQNAMWGNPNPPPPTEKHWGGGSNNSQGGASWNDSMVGSENGSTVWNPPVAKQRNVGNWSPASTPKKEMPPSGWELPSPPTNRRPPVTNYDDGTSVWGNPQRQGKVSHWKDMPSAKPIMNSGNNLGNPSGMPPMSGGGMQQSGPGMIRLPSGATMNSKNDMSAMWGKPSMNRGAGWQDMASHDGPNIGTWGDDGMHMGNSMKNMSGNANVAGGGFGGGNGWGEQQNNSMSGGYWANKSKNSNWADGQVDTSSWLGPSKQSGKPLSRDLIWASKQFRLLMELGFKKDDVENVLRNNNMAWEESLAELRANNAAMDGGMMDIDGFHGRKVRPATLQDDMSMSDNVLDINFNGGNFHSSGFQSGGNFQGMGNIGAFKPQIKGPNNASSLLNNTIGGLQSNIGSVGNVTPLFQKLLQQQPQSTQNNMQQFASNVLSSQSSRVGPNPFPSTAQLRHLVQQIQMAVQAGHLNPQILNQPLAPQTLQLLYQLLQQIKVLHQLQNTPKSAMGGSIHSVQITQTKQRILNLQNQINAQQAVFLKQQVPIQPAQLHAPQSSNDIYKSNMESLPSLHNDFRDLSIKDVPLQGHHQQSRLTQWKLPSSYEKEDQLCIPSNDFSRAPGPMPSKTSSASSSGPNLHPLLSQGDSAWSSLSRSQTESGWPEPTTPLTGLSDNSAGSGNVSVPASMSNSLGIGNNSNVNSGSLDSNSKEPSTTPPSSGPSTSSASHPSYSLTDLVPEFEPGKPWKGTQMKNIEDDPHITPGSIARSPLSVNTIKDADLFWNSKSNSSAAPGNDNAGSLVSNTWMYNQPNQSNSSSGLNNKTGNSKSNWSTNESNSGSDMWGSKPRGPPPGISAQGCEKQGNTSFLLLRNLTPQIDGSTLKTLCMQHGPLVLFHLSLNHGIALVRYSTKEEASKAQSALNNCVLGNTTILADIPNDGEIQQYLVLLCNQNTPAGYLSWSGSQQGSSNNSSGNGASGVRSNNAAPMSTYPFSLPSGNSANGAAAKQQDSTGWNGNNLNMPSQLWPISNPSSSLWGMPQPISDHESSTNSSLNRFLPDDLLGGESM